MCSLVVKLVPQSIIESVFIDYMIAIQHEDKSSMTADVSSTVVGQTDIMPAFFQSCILQRLLVDNSERENCCRAVQFLLFPPFENQDEDKCKKSTIHDAS